MVSGDRLPRGDRKRFEALWEGIEFSIRKFLAQTTTREVEDLLQNTAKGVWQQTAHRDLDSFSAYAWKVARNVAAEWVRKQKRTRIGVTRLAADSREPPHDPAVKASQEEIRQAIRDFLDERSETDRSILLRHDALDEDYKTIARDMQMTVYACTSVAYRLRKLIRERIHRRFGKDGGI